MWVPRNGAQARHVPRVLSLVTDPRATEYWDEHAAVIAPFTPMLSLTGPCAGLFLIYPPGVRWDGATPPQPAYVEDAHARQYNRPWPQWDVGRFRDSVRTHLRR